VKLKLSGLSPAVFASIVRLRFSRFLSISLLIFFGLQLHILLSFWLCFLLLPLGLAFQLNLACCGYHGFPSSPASVQSVPISSASCPALAFGFASHSFNSSIAFASLCLLSITSAFDSLHRHLKKSSQSLRLPFKFWLLALPFGSFS
jgi:hypothetical protein